MGERFRRMGKTEEPLTQVKKPDPPTTQQVYARITALTEDKRKAMQEKYNLYSKKGGAAEEDTDEGQAKWIPDSVKEALLLKTR